MKTYKSEINEIIKWLESIAWCNAHDSAWIEKTIEKLKNLKDKKNEIQ